MVRLVTVAAWSGIATPIVMVALWILASVLRPGYDQLTMRGSELSTGSFSIVMNSNFVITGLLAIVFSLGMVRNVHGGYWSRIGLFFLGVSGVAETVAGFFPCDPGCPLFGSTFQLVHTGIAVVFFPSISVAPLLTSLGLDQDNFWKSYRNYSLVSGVLSIVGLAVFSWSVLTMFQYIGLVQRLFLATPFQWIGIMAYQLRSANMG